MDRVAGGYNLCMRTHDRVSRSQGRPFPRGALLLGDIARISLPVRLLALFGWLLLVLYPNPLQLGDSIDHLRHGREDAAAVAALAARLPDDPRKIERIVLDRIVPYGYDWQVSGVPWYFPTAAEAVAARRGDCESRALVLASILKAKHIPHRLLMSFDHIWVDYAGKTPNAMENAAVAIAGQGKGGGFSLHWPKDFHPWQELQAQLEIYWGPMPWLLKILLFGGALLILGANALRRLVMTAGGGRPTPCERRPARRRTVNAARRVPGGVRG
jgi:hypothetical protein